MKTDRLYALTLYLLNHGKSSASELAKHFEVSVRTIQRDIEALCQAGIPIYALTGTNGGYEILSDFRMNNQLASEDEYGFNGEMLYGIEAFIDTILVYIVFLFPLFLLWAVCLLGAVISTVVIFCLKK